MFQSNQYKNKLYVLNITSEKQNTNKTPNTMQQDAQTILNDMDIQVQSMLLINKETARVFSDNNITYMKNYFKIQALKELNKLFYKSVGRFVTLNFNNIIEKIKLIFYTEYYGSLIDFVLGQIKEIAEICEKSGFKTYLITPNTLSVSYT